MFMRLRESTVMHGMETWGSKDRWKDRKDRGDILEEGAAGT
jgi:hypothetical protein